VSKLDPRALRVMVLGGSSEIALAIVTELQSERPCHVALVGRDREALAHAAAELGKRGCHMADASCVDALAFERHAAVLEESFQALGGTADVVVLAVGVLGERGGIPSSVEGAVDVLEVNLAGAGSLLLHAASHLRTHGGGTIVVLSSVAAERPRRANVVYGASKAGLDALARGLGDALLDDGVRIVVVRPGFVRTRMTQGLAPAPLATTPQAVARIVAGALHGHARVVWVPRPLRWVMAVMRTLPGPIFRRIER
jgi:decaprenylphospho-beta-D-erythro-pentofuranosid-2-ulose 2-reductase